MQPRKGELPMRKSFLIYPAVILGLIGGLMSAQETQTPPPDRRLYVVGTAHLDTQWRWTIQQTINEYIPATLRENFKLFEAFPDYTFSFEGAFRYMLMREYYPKEYARLKQYVDSGRWRVAGSWVDAVDTNVPSPESLIRQALYGNGYFQQEFGKTSRDVFLPDCFGFGYALPSVAKHCGIESFSTQKLTWGSSVKVPFNVGLWEGVDGSTVVAELNPGDYVSKVRGDLSRDTTWTRIVQHQGDTSGIYAGYHYIGTGDTGGSPDSESVVWLEKSMHSDGPLKVVSTGSDELGRILTDEQKAKLPHYKGELLMTRHGVGCYTSEAAMKRFNRKNELLADAAERACVIADQLGVPYPRQELRDTRVRFLWHQFHDDLTGTSIPQAYQFSWNDESWAANRFAGLLEDAVSATASVMDTRAQGVPLIVYNPLSINRKDIVEAQVVFDSRLPQAVRIFDPDGHETPSQVTARDGNSLTVLFLAEVPSVGYAVFDVRSSDQGYNLNTGLIATDSSLENHRYRVMLDKNGDVASIYDKQINCELLSGPVQLQLLEDTPKRWPAWEIDYDDISAAPRAVVGGPAKVRIVETGPVRAALEVERKVGGSTFMQKISLACGDVGDRVDFTSDVDWQEKATLLKAAFQFTSANDSVDYDLGLGTIRRGLNSEKKYEVPAQQWADLSSPNGTYGVSVLNDCKYGWDHPNRNTLRLSLIHTPGVTKDWSWVGDQASQDLGRHRFTFAIAGHKETRQTSKVPWEAARLNQPLLAFQAQPHEGKIGRRFSFLKAQEFISPDFDVETKAIKLMENSGEIGIRLQGSTPREEAPVIVTFNKPVISAREINGAEEPLGTAEIKDGKLITDLKHNHLRAFAVKLADTNKPLSALASTPLSLPCNLDGISSDGEVKGGNFDGRGNSLPAELLSEDLTIRGVSFAVKPELKRRSNLLRPAGQTVTLPVGDYNRVDILACAVGGRPERGLFRIDGQAQSAWIPDGEQWIGQWNSRLVGDTLVEDPAAIAPAFAANMPVGWTATHLHDADGKNIAYQYATFYLVRLNLPAGAKTLTLPDNPNLRLLAGSAVKAPEAVRPAQPLYDTPNATLAEIHASRRNFIDSTVVDLTSPVAGAEVRYTTDGSDPTPQSPLYAGPITLANTATVKARAFKEGMDDGYVASAHVYRHIPLPSVTASTTAPGLVCRYYETDTTWEALPNFDTLKTARETAVKNFIIPNFARKEYFALKLTGLVKVPRDGMYKFSTTSDDGSALYIGDRMVVNNDGIHGEWEESGEIALKAGYHPITVLMFQGKGGKTLGVQMEGPGVSKEMIPGAWLSHTK